MVVRAERPFTPSVGKPAMIILILAPVQEMQSDLSSPERTHITLGRALSFSATRLSSTTNGQTTVRRVRARVNARNYGEPADYVPCKPVILSLSGISVLGSRVLLAVGTSCGPRRHLPVVTKNMPADEVPTGATPSFFILHCRPYIDTEQANIQSDLSNSDSRCHCEMHSYGKHDS